MSFGSADVNDLVLSQESYQDEEAWQHESQTFSEQVSWDFV